jgi:hypothetical protein
MWRGGQRMRVAKINLFQNAFLITEITNNQVKTIASTFCGREQGKANANKRQNLN